MEEKKTFFRMEMTIDKAYLRRTWKPLAKLKKVRWLIMLLPLVCLLYAFYLLINGQDVPLGIPIMAAIFLLFALMLPSLMLSQIMAQYRQYQADGRRCISLEEDGVETELVKYHNTLFHAYRDFDRLEEDNESYYLVSQGGQKVIIPKGPCLEGDSAGVKPFLEERLAACRAEAALEEAEEGGENLYLEDDDPTGESTEEVETAEE